MSAYDNDRPDARPTGEDNPDFHSSDAFAAVARARELLTGSRYEPIGSEQAGLDAKVRAWQTNYGES